MILTYDEVPQWVKRRFPLGHHLRVHVLTSCTFLKDIRAMPAEELYQGQQHIRLMKGVEALRTSGRGTARVSIVSARYGVVRGRDVIKPYDETFQGMGPQRIRNAANRIAIPEGARRFLLEGGFDLKIIALGDAYLEACSINFENRDLFRTMTVVYCSKRRAKRMPIDNNNLAVVALGNQEASRYNCGIVGLKGELARRLLTTLAQDDAGLVGVRSSQESGDDRLGEAQGVDHRTESGGG